MNGRRIKAVAQITKQGFVYTFDRVTGTAGVADRREAGAAVGRARRARVADAAVPDEAGAVRVSGRDAPTISSTSRRNCAPWRSAAVKGFRIGPLFTPPSLEGTIARPGTVGGAQLVRRRRRSRAPGMIYIPSRNGFAVFTLQKPDAALNSNLLYMQAPGRSPQMPQGLPLLKPPYSRVTAIDMNTGEHAWMMPAGAGERIRNLPQLKGLDLPAARRRQHVQRAAGRPGRC